MCLIRQIKVEINNMTKTCILCIVYLHHTSLNSLIIESQRSRISYCSSIKVIFRYTLIVMLYRVSPYSVHLLYIVYIRVYPYKIVCNVLHNSVPKKYRYFYHIWMYKRNVFETGAANYNIE